MKSISRCFNKICTEKYEPLGFSKSRTMSSKNQFVFFRINEDVVQAFTLKRSHGVPICTVEFGILPLCRSAPVYLDEGGYELDTFMVEQHAKYSGWRFDPKVDESVVNCVNSMSEAIDLYLLPLFNRCCNCAEALLELVKLEELFEKNRIETLRLWGDTDHATLTWQERSLFDDRKYYMALKSHDLAYARQYLLFQVSYRKKALERFDSPDSPRQPDSVKERLSANLVRDIEQLKRVESADFDYFDCLLSFNEDKTLKFLADQYPRIR